MSIFHKTIFTGFSPNLTGRDTAIALSYLIFPWRWLSLRKGRYTKLAEKKITDYFKIKYAYTFDSGRSALYFALKALEAGEGDEILVQAYTCVVVANAIKYTGAKPVFVDVGDDFNMNPTSLESRITSKSKILIIQHTFGLPAKLDELLAIAKKYDLKVIEDCAHSLGARYNGQLTGTFGHIGMLSFGSDKIISCARGGALITADNALGERISRYVSELPKPSILKTIQHLLHYPVFYISKPIYHLYIGKIILMLAKKLNIINKIIYNKEKTGDRVNFYPAKLANSLANILCNQLEEIDELNKHRQEIAKIYASAIISVCHPGLDPGSSIYLRYPILVDNPKTLMSYAKKHGIILGDWYNCVLAPCSSDLAKSGYIPGSCPNAERLAARSVNLPTDRQIRERQVNKIINIINSFKHE